MGSIVCGRSRKDGITGDFEFPVVAFHGLDLSWQAYLFYTINIKPKKINASLAFDLYPLLRTEDWLEKFEGHVIYRETRAQELVDLIWSHPESPWHHRINMLGETGLKGYMLTQSAWIRSLLATYVRRWETLPGKIGGLFGAPVGSHQLTLLWSREEQAAFLITMGVHVRDAIAACKETWAKKLRALKPPELFGNENLAFSGPHTLISQDQGIRALLHVTNDLCYIRADDLLLEAWGKGGSGKGKDDERVSAAISSLKKLPVDSFLKKLAAALAMYDWRASSEPSLTETEKLIKGAFRGSGGYKDLRRHVLRHLAKDSGEVGNAAVSVLKALGFDKEN